MSDTNTTHKDSVLKQIDTGDIRNWNGLSQGITEDEVLRIFSATGQTDTVRLSGHSAIKKWYSTPNQKHSVVAWFQHDTVVLIQLWMPTLKDELRSVIKAMGKPEMKIEAAKGAVIPMATQWVFGKKGVTLYVNEFMKRPWSRKIPEGYIQAISFYHPVSSEYYRDSLGGNDTRIKLPGR